MQIFTFGVNDGHTISGAGCGANGFINESEHTRLVGNEVRRLLKERSQKVVDCTIDKASSTSENLRLIVEQANRQDLDWFISIHFNASGGKGVEVYTYEGRQYQDAVDVCKNIAGLGFVNRGVKSGSGLYVISKTKAKSMLVEVCFVDTKSDVDQYLKVGYKAVAKAIVDGVLGAVENETVVIPPVVTPEPSTPTQPTTPSFTGDAWVLSLQKELNVQGYRSKDGKKLVEDGLAGPKTLEACPLLKKDTRGNITKLLQQKLVSCGYSTNGVDGIFGNGTLNAVKQFQKAKGLTADGICGNNTWKKLLGL